MAKYRIVKTKDNPTLYYLQVENEKISLLTCPPQKSWCILGEFKSEQEARDFLNIIKNTYSHVIHEEEF